jgi:hypothetical protein
LAASSNEIVDVIENILCFVLLPLMFGKGLAGWIAASCDDPRSVSLDPTLERLVPVDFQGIRSASRPRPARHSLPQVAGFSIGQATAQAVSEVRPADFCGFRQPMRPRF